MQKIKEGAIVVAVVLGGALILGVVIFGSNQTPKALAEQGALLGVGEVWADGKDTSAGWSITLQADKPLGEEVSSRAPKAPAENLDGAGLLRQMGWQDKVVYLVYGRPSLRGEQTWGSLYPRTAELAWTHAMTMRNKVMAEAGRSKDDVALTVINPVYRSQNGVISDAYIQKALELAEFNNGLVALSFNSFAEAEATIKRLETVFSPHVLAYLSVSLDIEHFPGGGTATAQAINQFSNWYAQKRATWAESKNIPGLVIVYTFRTQGVGSITNLGALKQYYLQERTLVVPIFDGYGTRQAKAPKVAALVSALPNTAKNPALVGVMEFQSRWGTKYDKATIAESFNTLAGAPVYFFASQ